MRWALAAVFVLSACAGGAGTGKDNASPFGSAGGPGGGNASDDGDDDDTEGGDESTSESPSMTNATGEPNPTNDPTNDPTGVDGSDDGAPQDQPDGPAPTGDCCTAGPAGCANDPAVEACVCQLDDFCCTTEWDETCVAMVGECAPGCPGAMQPGDQGGSSEGGFDDTGFGEDGGGGGDCCAPTGVPGCADPQVAQCVCGIDDYCCFVEWDDVCAEIALECGC